MDLERKCAVWCIQHCHQIQDAYLNYIQERYRGTGDVAVFVDV